MNIEISVDVFGVLKGLDIKSKAIEQGIKNGIEKSAFYLEAKMVDKITSNIPPPLKEATIKAKGSSATLIDTGELLGQITVSSDLASRGAAVKVGVQGSRAAVATYHEFGAPSINLPERSFMRSTYNSEKSKIEDIIKDEVIKAIKT